ncbi:CPBP family intramembrane glutamic endopeptidase [Halorussus amylolyticus]|uniref:CPBP family intramembrane glutamic endopeptidase n=1 Tax=Halorussus amylolyticus TaxID=1126242 RepID=UPI00138F2029|nr:CPBP family intramembrane glutamic endopeptidase [Halorussus amylolyticus]
MTTKDGRLRATWRGLLPLVVSYLVQLLVILGLFSALVPETDGAPPTPVALAVLVGMGLTLMATAGIALIVAARLDGRAYAEYGFDWSLGWLRDWVGGVAIGVLMVGVVAVYLSVRGYATLALDVSWNGGTFGPFLSIGVLTGVLFYFLANNVYEEVVFRAILLRNFAEGLTARTVGALPAVGGATAASLVVFGFYHPLPPGGGGIHSALTSAGLGVVFALAYVVSGQLSLPIGIHFGGVSLLSMSGESVFGIALPTVVTLTFTTAAPTYEILFVRILAGVVLVVGWAALLYDGVSVHKSLSR